MMQGQSAIQSGFPMSILTCRELEFLASLKTSWQRLYWNELAHLFKQDDHGDVGHEANSAGSEASQQTAEAVLKYQYESDWTCQDGL